MAVSLNPPTHLNGVAGVSMGSTQAVKSRKRDDLTVFALAPNSVVAGVFTQNRFAAAPVQVCRSHLVGGVSSTIRGLVVNAGIANAGTGAKGLSDAKQSCKNLGQLLRHPARHILPFSTGVIIEHLPMASYTAGLKRCVDNLSADNWDAAARAIMTTDTVPKGVSSICHGKAITGIAKGSGMIFPNMATMLAFVATDAAIPPATLKKWQQEITRLSFNAISVDGDTSTNDSFILIATGRKGAPTTAEQRDIKKRLTEHCITLAEAIVRDGEGANKFIVLDIKSDTVTLCRKIAACIANSPLVKTAFAAGDANIGRLLMAIGNVSAPINPQTVNCQLNQLPLVSNGRLSEHYDEKQASQALAQNEFTLHIQVGNPKHRLQFKTCDLTHKYIEINADYRS